MKIVCAWCNRKIGGKGSLLSHGICKRCFTELMQTQFDFMHTLPVAPGTSFGSRSRNQLRARESSGLLQPALRLFV